MVMSPADVSNKTDIFLIVVTESAKVEARVTRCQPRPWVSHRPVVQNGRTRLPKEHLDQPTTQISMN